MPTTWIFGKDVTIDSQGYNYGYRTWRPRGLVLFYHKGFQAFQIGNKFVYLVTGRRRWVCMLNLN